VQTTLILNWIHFEGGNNAGVFLGSGSGPHVHVFLCVSLPGWLWSIGSRVIF